MNGSASRRALVLAGSAEATSTSRSPVTAANRRKLPVGDDALDFRGGVADGSQDRVEQAPRAAERNARARGRRAARCRRARAPAASASTEPASRCDRRGGRCNSPSEVAPVTRCSSATSVTSRRPPAASRRRSCGTSASASSMRGFGAEVANARQRLAHGRRVGVGRVTPPGRKPGGHAREVGGLGMAPAHRGNGRHQWIGSGRARASAGGTRPVPGSVHDGARSIVGVRLARCQGAGRRRDTYVALRATPTRRAHGEE